MSVPTIGYVHHALFFGSDAELMEAAVPFLRAGLAAGEAVVLVCDDRKNALLFEALDRDQRIGFLERAGTYLRTPIAVAVYRRMVERQLLAGAQRVRLVGEVDFGHDPATWAEWIRYESVVNVALAPYPLSSVCAYDTRTLPQPALTAGRATHPNLLTPAGRITNDGYQDPTVFLRRWMAVDPADPLEATVPAFAADGLTDITELAVLRDNLRAVLARAGVPDQPRSDFVTAVSEVTANAVVHGRSPVQVRVWASPGRLLGAVTDQGDGVDDPLAGYTTTRRSGPHRPGMGLWLARQLCDQVEMSRTADGFTIRLTSTIPDIADRLLDDATQAQDRADQARLRAARARARTEEALRSFEKLEATTDALGRGHQSPNRFTPPR
jgi:anti-sigma regulatory factor (Ser/Thr protein kinase)